MTPRTLAIGTGLDLPLEFATQTSALIGKRGVGKTHCAVVFAEELLDAGLPVVILDPIGVWWGLRSSADGKAKGHAILVLGGEHGDLPLDATQGALVAGWVIAKRRSVVIDMGEFSKGDQARFVAEFLEQLFRKSHEPLHVIIDEADAFAPQRLHPGAQRCFGAVDQVVRRGRARGLGVTLVTQRSAAINKDVLSQVEVLVAFRTLAPQDRAALEAWIEVHGDREEAKRVLMSLASLEVGEAWVWSPGWLGILARVRVRRRRTFDSSATPKVGAVILAPKATAAIDVDELRGELAALVKKADEEDPRRLRARLAQLERDLVAAKAAVAPAKRVEVPVISERALASIEKLMGRALELSEAITAMQVELAKVITRFGPDTCEVPAGTSTSVTGTVTAVTSAMTSLRGLRIQVARPNGGSAPPATAARQASDLDRPSRAILTVLAQHPDGCDRGRLALLAGYRWSGGFRNALGALRTAGLIAGANIGLMVVTEAGLRALGPFDPLPAAPRDVVGYWLKHPSLGACERAVLEALVGAGEKGLTSEHLMTKTGYAWSGGFRNALGKLRTAGLLEGRNTDVMRASAHLLG